MPSRHRPQSLPLTLRFAQLCRCRATQLLRHLSFAGGVDPARAIGKRSRRVRLVRAPVTSASGAGRAPERGRPGSGIVRGVCRWPAGLACLPTRGPVRSSAAHTVGGSFVDSRSAGSVPTIDSPRPLNCPNGTFCATCSSPTVRRSSRPTDRDLGGRRHTAVGRGLSTEALRRSHQGRVWSGR